MTGRLVDICRRVALPAIITALVLAGMVSLHYAAVTPPPIDLGPFKDIRKISRGTSI